MTVIANGPARPEPGIGTPIVATEQVLAVTQARPIVPETVPDMPVTDRMSKP